MPPGHSWGNGPRGSIAAGRFFSNLNRPAGLAAGTRRETPTVEKLLIVPVVVARAQLVIFQPDSVDDSETDCQAQSEYPGEVPHAALLSVNEIQ